MGFLIWNSLIVVNPHFPDATPNSTLLQVNSLGLQALILSVQLIVAYPITMFYFNLIKELLPDEWDDYKNYRLTHITCLNVLAIVGNELINENYLAKSQQPDSVKIANKLLSLGEIDWSASGEMKFIKGVAGSKLLANDIKGCLK